jgi:hypothetical protein
MVMVGDITEGSNETIEPHRDAFRRIKHGEAVNVGAPANYYSRVSIPWASSQEDDIVIKSNRVVDHDIPRIPRNTNPTDPTMFAHMYAN